MDYENEEQSLEPVEGKLSPKSRRTYPWAMPVVAALFVIVAFLSWWGTWFGRTLSDSQMKEYLHDTEKPRHAQHAVEQIVKRITEHDPSVSRWYPDVAALAQHPAPQVRSAAAWAMQYDPGYDGFHKALLGMLQDTDASARHQAALSLVPFGDASGRAELIEMLKPHTLRAEASGRATVLVKEGAAVAAGSAIARIKQNDGQTIEIRASESGRVERSSFPEEGEVAAGGELITLSPEIAQVENVFVALGYVGQPEDIPYIQPYTREIPGMPDRVRKQAALVADDIRNRSGAR